MIITIDGPSGTGKTTVARKVAEQLHFIYFDTGAMYRAFTWFALEQNIDINDSLAVQALFEKFVFKMIEVEGKKHYFVGEHDVTEVIRSHLVTAQVSAVSALREVRLLLLKMQHQFAEEQNAVFEGRDLGTVVFPNAELKIFLNADPQVRAERRLNEILQQQPAEAKTMSREQVLFDIRRRDEYDSNREVAPLRCPDDAFQLDTTYLSIPEVVDWIVKCFEKKFPNKSLI